MSSGGMIRKIDDLGRIVLPVELRRVLDIAERDEMEIYLEDDKIILRKHEKTCVFCGSSAGLTTYQRKCVCANCIRNLVKT